MGAEPGYRRQDVAIGNQQLRIAQDGVLVTTQERVITQLEADNASRTVDFLSMKFTNVELYDWMAGVLQGVYRYFLQQATSVAQLAQHQLAFERQETAPPFIQADYWEPPPTSRLPARRPAPTGAGSPAPRGCSRTSPSSTSTGSTPTSASSS